MTVIAWDGKTLAADKMGSRGDTISTWTKIFKGKRARKPYYAAICGSVSDGTTLHDWFKAGAKPSLFPKFYGGCDATLVVIYDGKCLEYGGRITPLELEDSFIAWGNGREFAIGAMEMGADAIEAVKAASKHCIGCGRGVDFFDTTDI